MSDRTTSRATRSATSSPASEAGALDCDWQDGLTTDQSGPAVAPASPSARPADAKDSTTTGICGPSGTPSSPSDVLQSSLESRLRQLLTGSDLCEVIWKPWRTPWGACLSRPRARVRTTYATGSGSWPTPTTRDHKDGHYQPNVPVNGLLGRMVWPTPTSLAKAKAGYNEAGNSAGLVAIRKHALATWQSPTAKGNSDSPSMAKWPGSVAASIGSSAPTERRGALNPEFVCWLMGFPAEWVSCGVSATPSTQGRRRPSSRRTGLPVVSEVSDDGAFG